MKKSVFKLLAGTLLLSIVCTFSIAAIQPENRMNMDVSLQEGETVFSVVDQMPKFPGGDEKLLKFINENIVYPESAKESKTEGRVVLTFIVEKDGSLSNIKVVRSISDDLDNEAMNVLKKMPDWEPAQHAGKTVRVRYTMPIVFRL